MNNTKKLIQIIVIIFTFTCSLISQEIDSSRIDCIYFVDGKKIEGKLNLVKEKVVLFTEGETGIQYEFRKNEIRSIRMANGKTISFIGESNVENGVEKPSKKDEKMEFVKKRLLLLLGGATFPSGDFGATSGDKAGFAKTGFSFGFEYISSFQSIMAFALSGSYCANPVDDVEIKKIYSYLTSISSVETQNWISIAITSGLTFLGSSDRTTLFVSVQGGIFYGSTPEIKVKTPVVEVTQSSASAGSFCYLIEGGLIFANRICVLAKYLAAEPEYEVTARAGLTTLTQKFTQPTKNFYLSIGIIFD